MLIRSKKLVVHAAVASLLAASAAVAASAFPAQAAGSTPSFPFPTHVTYKVGVMPSAAQAARDTAVEREYDSWKATYLTHGCASNEYYVNTKGDHDATNDGPVSEGQGYGMNIVPLMAGYDANAKAEFDGLWQLVKDHEDQYGMMQWQLDGKTCKYYSSGTPDGATDGDLDIGYGLILADKQWGGYTADAKTWLANFYAHNVAPDGHLKCEDDGPNTDTRPSDHMIDHLRAFAAYDTAHDWNKVIARTEAVDGSLVANYSSSYGLLPDFVVNANTTPKPAPANYQENQPDNIVGYNSIRVPWHMGTDALLNGSTTAAFELSDATKWSACAKAVSGGKPGNVYPHLNLNCTAHGTSDVAEEAGDSIGPAAMASGDQAWTDAIWAQLATNPYGDGYFGESIKTLVYIVMAGDYWSPAATTAPSNDFSIATGPASGSVSAGGTATTTVSTAVASGSAESVALTASGGPAGATITLSPTSVTAGGSSTLSVATASGTASGTYPITVTGTAASATHTATYTLTVGTVSGPTSYEAEAAANTLVAPATVISCTACSGGSRVGHLGVQTGGTGALTFTNVTATGGAGSYQVVVTYTNGASANRTAQISVNGGAAVAVAFTPTGSYSTPGTKTVTLTLAAGTNTVTFTNTGAKSPDLDKITVPAAHS